MTEPRRITPEQWEELESETREVISFKEDSVELAHRQQIIKQLYSAILQYKDDADVMAIAHAKAMQNINLKTNKI